MKLKPSECINDDELHDSRLNIINNDQRTSSMSSFVDAHTPSESPEASSSESSTDGDWQSGELGKSNELCVEHWPKQRTFSNSKTKQPKKQLVANIIINNNKSSTATQTATITTSASSILPAKLSHQNQFKAKSNSIKIFGNTSNLSRSNNVTSVVTNININNNVHLSKLNSKKMRWLWNMRTDPDFNETLVKTVNIQTPPSELQVASGGGVGGGRKSSDSLSDMDYYSAICDNQLSVGSPYKSPSDRVPTLLNEQMKLRARTSSFTKRHLHQQQLQLQQQAKHMHASPSSSSSLQLSSQCSKSDGLTSSCDPILVVAKPIESQSIGFNVIDSAERKNAAEKRSEAPTNIGSPSLVDNAKRPKSSDFDEMIPVSASSSSSLFSTTNEQNSIFDFSFSPKASSTCSGSGGGTSSSSGSVKHPKVSIGFDSTDTSASNSPTDESPSKHPMMLSLNRMLRKNAPSSAPLPPIRSASTSSTATTATTATDCDEIDGCMSSKLTASPWSSDTSIVPIACHEKQQSNAAAAAAGAVATAAADDTIDGSHDLTARSSTSSNSTTSSSSSTSLSNVPQHVKRGRPPFSFREFRNELRSVMRQNRNISK